MSSVELSRSQLLQERIRESLETMELLLGDEAGAEAAGVSGAGTREAAARIAVRPEFQLS